MVLEKKNLLKSLPSAFEPASAKIDEEKTQLINYSKIIIKQKKPKVLSRQSKQI